MIMTRRELEVVTDQIMDSVSSWAMLHDKKALRREIEAILKTAEPRLRKNVEERRKERLKR
jgi:predicted component of type VI protein secretion system